MKKKKTARAIDRMVYVPDIKMPFEIGRFFVDGNRHISFSNEQASLGEDYGSLDELRKVVEWLADQFGGKVDWDDK